MKIQLRYSLITAGLIGAVVASIGVTTARSQRAVLEAQAQERLDTLGEGVARLAQESVQSQDRFMLLSYLMWLRRDHPELVFAAVSRGGHTATMGDDGPGLVYWSRAVAAIRPVKYTVTASPASSSLAVSTAGVSLTASGNVDVKVEQQGQAETVGLKLGFSKAALDAALAKALAPLYERTLAIASGFMLLGFAGAFSVGKLLTAPLEALTAAVGAVGEGNLEVAVRGEESRDELGALARRFNEATGRIKELLRFREDVLHTLTHELNTPLGGLKGSLELWQDSGLPSDPAKRAEVLQTMTAAVLRMEQSLGGALRLFAPQSKGLDSERRLVWLDDAARDVATLFAPVARSKNVTVELPAPDCVECVFADPELVRRVVGNLLSNAIKYTPKDGRVAVTLESRGDSAALSVSDTGRGISPEDLPRIFDKFYRAGSAGERIPGSGLGLTIAQRAAEALGGKLTVDSELGKGSTFTVVIPRRMPKGGSHVA